MKNKEVLVTYYSRSGFTKKTAEEIAKNLNCDIEEIVEKGDRNGFKGYWRSIIDSTFGRLAPIENPKKDLSRYGLVIIGTPVWSSAVSSPIRTYLSQNKERFNHVAFFLTQGGVWGRKRVFDQMKEVCGKDPVAVLAVRDIENVKGQDHAKIRDFLRDVKEVIAISSEEPREPLREPLGEAAGH